MKVACSPRVVVPLVLGIGIIAVLLGYANVDQVLQAASAFQPHYFLLILLLTLAYEALRAMQWLLFLRVLNHRKAWRGCLMSFMGSCRRPRLRAVSAWYAGFIGSADSLLCLRALGPAAALSAAYIAVAALELWAIAAGLGLHSIGFEQALVVYAFALAAGLIVPVPIDLGLTELSGLAALMACGVPRADALTVMLLQRLLSSTLTAGISLVSLAVLRRHVAAALHTRHWPTSSKVRD